MPTCECGRRGTHARWCPVNTPETSSAPARYVCSCRLPCQCKDYVAKDEGKCRHCRAGNHIKPNREGKMVRQTASNGGNQQKGRPNPSTGQPGRGNSGQSRPSNAGPGSPRNRRQPARPRTDTPSPSRQKVHCAGCDRIARDPNYPYCLNCTKKGRPVQKKPGECAYGACHEPVKKRIIFTPFSYCPLHQSQYERGIISGTGEKTQNWL